MKWTDWKKIFRSQNSGEKLIKQDSEEYVKTFMKGFERNITVTTPEQAMRLDTVYRCVDILSGTIASLPIYFRRRSGVIYDIVTDSPLNDIFRGEANERQTFFVLMQNAIISVLLNGNAYIYPERNEQGDVVQLYLLSNGSVEYDRGGNVYRVYDSVNNIFRTFGAWEIIHLKNKSLDGGYTGVSTITYASRILSVSANADEQTLGELKRGNKMRGFISGGNPVSGLGQIQDEMQDKVIERLERELDADKAIMRLPGSISFSPISINPADAQLLETRKFSPYGICRFFGVHPDMVFVEQNSNYKASENSQITFLNQTLNPILSQIEAEFFVKLISLSPKVRRNYQIKYDRYELQSTDAKTRAEYVKMSIEAGVLTPNEARIRDNRPPVEGGDQTFISCNVAPINSAKIKGEKSSTKNEE